MIGTTVSHYKIIEKLGEGGMGEVYLADDIKLERKVAIKFLPVHLTKNKENVERFEREAKATAALNHPNIITIHDVIETGGAETGGKQICIVMEYVDGKSLREVLDEYKLGIDKITDIISQISTGLQQAHRAGIVHRDIKPENIFVGRDGRVRILDFGIAKLKGVSKLTKETSTLGTIHYMSPEQTRGEAVDNRSDIWSLGVILYEMLSGQIPFKGDYDQAVMYAITNENPQPLIGIAVEWEQIVKRALAKDPQHRYQHVDELLSELERIKKETAQPGETDSKKYLKSIIFPLIILFVAIIAVAVYVWLTPDEQRASEWDNSIAVLPFDNISADPDQEYFCDGMTEQIISNLSRIARLKVISRTSVMIYKNTNKTTPEIGKALNVAYVLEGSIRKFGDRIRVTAQLISTSDDFHVWSEDYDQEYRNLFDVQDEVSTAIASALLENLSVTEVREIQTKRPVNTEAHEYFLKAYHFTYEYNRFHKLVDFKTSESLYKKAIEIDKNFAPFHASLSELYGEYIYYNRDEENKYRPMQEKYVKIALRLDPNSAQVLYSYYHFLFQTKESEKAYEVLRQAFKSNPNHFGVNQQMGIFLRLMGLADHSFDYFDRSIEVNPLGHWSYTARGRAYFDIGEFNKAEEDYKSNFEIEPDDYWTMLFYTDLLVMLQSIIEAEKLLKHFENKHPQDDYPKYYKSLLLAMQGDSVAAIRLFEETGFGGMKRVKLYLVFNRNEDALSLMTELQENGDPENQVSNYLQLSHLKWYDNLRSDPRFQNILRQQKERYEANLLKYGDLRI